MYFLKTRILKSSQTIVFPRQMILESDHLIDFQLQRILQTRQYACCTTDDPKVMRGNIHVTEKSEVMPDDMHPVTDDPETIPLMTLCAIC